MHTILKTRTLKRTRTNLIHLTGHHLKNSFFFCKSLAQNHVLFLNVLKGLVSVGDNVRTLTYGGNNTTHTLPNTHNSPYTSYYTKKNTTLKWRITHKQNIRRMLDVSYTKPLLYTASFVLYKTCTLYTWLDFHMDKLLVALSDVNKRSLYLTSVRSLLPGVLLTYSSVIFSDLERRTMMDST